MRKANHHLWVILILLIISLPLKEKSYMYRGLASSWHMIPSRSLAGLHYLFKGHDILEEEGIVKVSGPVIEITHGDALGAKIFNEGYFAELDLEDFEEQQNLGKSVFEARSGSGQSVGTAFLVGSDILLTNRHVLNILPTAKNWNCGKFSIKLNHKEESLHCKKVLFCSKRYDYCVVRMNALESGLDLASEVKPLRMARKILPNKDMLLMHIGNAAGLGIQASAGKGIHVEKGEFYHFAPTLIGSSGAPLFNERGLVIGINWGHTGGHYIQDDSFNRGVLSETIFYELKNLSPQTLNEIKSFRAWHRSYKSHRKITIQR